METFDLLQAQDICIYSLCVNVILNGL